MKTSLKLISWNILEGGCSDWQTKTIDENRLQFMQMFVSNENADVVVLNEALWGEPAMEHFIDYKTLFEMPYSFYHAYDGAWGNIVLSKMPFVEAQVWNIHNRSGLIVTLPFENKHGQLRVGTYHPHPSRYPAHKGQDFSDIIDMMGPHPSLLMGDFNAISPDDNVDEVALTQAFRRFSNQPATALARFTDGGRRVFDTLSKRGFVDCVADPTHTIPTHLLGDTDSAMRIDHCWRNKFLEAQARVVQNDLTHFASDHYPLVVDVRL